MHPDYIKEIAEQWVFDLTDFVNKILLEDDKTEIISMILSVIHRDAHCALQDVARCCRVSGCTRLDV